MLNGEVMMTVVTEFTPFASTLGGVLIGLSAVILMLFHGRVAGISGIIGRVLPPYGGAEPMHAAAFLAGLIGAPLLYVAAGDAITQTVSSNAPLMIAGGLLVGFGAAYGGGCTSGHGVCGLARISPVSLVATAAFMTTGFLTVLIARHVFGG
jgi:uncharacterized membrane protein YedE/YeeE